MAPSAFKMVFVVVLMALSLVGIVDAHAEVVHDCPYDVSCATVVGYDPDDDTPVDQRPGVSWVKQPRGQVLTSNFADHPPDTGIALMCSRDPNDSKPLVTQLEYTWMQDEGKTYFDVSNVEGQPFINEGFGMALNDPETPLLDTCYGAHCAAGDSNCNQVYQKSTDDFQGMRTCSDSVVVRLTLCSG